jgi:uncharacterized lipoprotein YajG
MKKVMILLVGLAFLTGCTSVQHVWDKAVEIVNPTETTETVTDENL